MDSGGMKKKTQKKLAGEKPNQFISALEKRTLNFDLGAQFDDPVSRDFEIISGVAGVARHGRKQDFAPARHAAANG